MRVRERERERTSVIGMECFSVGTGLSRVTEISEEVEPLEATDTGERALKHGCFEEEASFSGLETSSSSSDSSSESLFSKASVASSFPVNMCFRSRALWRYT